MEFGLIGKKLGHSFSPKIHNLLGDYNYILKEIPEEELKDFFDKKDFLGLNVTIPYKEKVMEFLSVVDKKALEIGAVNTVVNKNGVLYGYNTDYFGLKYLLESNDISVKGKSVAILGSGGASKTAFVLLKDLGAKSVITVSRQGKYNYNNQKEYSSVDIIINASPVGMYPMSGECSIDLNIFNSLQAVVDLVYNPFVTELMLLARKKGIKSVNGLTMLVFQALKASELFFDKEIDKNKIAVIEKKIEKDLLNIVFVGMPGSGKSTLAKILAEKLNKEFVDLDIEFEKVYKITPEKCILDFGEREFREKESAILTETLKRSGLVISTGGGAVLREENRKAIKSNGKCLYINRSVCKLSTNNRPLSKDENALKEMLKTRHPLYLEVADFIVENDGDIGDTIEKINKIIIG
jgi:shikimate dehydrogenase